MAETALQEQDNGEGESAPQETENESQARRMGWRPKEEYRGTGEWVDADTFIKRGETELPILRARLKSLDGRFVEQGNKLQSVETELRGVKDVLTDFRKFAQRGEERAYARAKQELEEQMRSSATNADVAGVEAARKGLEQLERENNEAKPSAKVEETKPPVAKPDPTIDAWVTSADRRWFRDSPTMNAFATTYCGELQHDKPGMPIGDILEEVEAEVKRRFPEKFGITKSTEAQPNENRTRAAPVSTPGGQGGGRKKGKSFEDLPADAKSAYQRFERQMPGYTKEDYLKGYIAANGEEW